MSQFGGGLTQVLLVASNSPGRQWFGFGLSWCAPSGALFGAGIQTVAAVSAFDNQAASAVGASGDAAASRRGVCRGGGDNARLDVEVGTM